MSLSTRNTAFAAFAASALLLAACGDDGDTPTPQQDTGADVGLDVPVQDTGNDTTNTCEDDAPTCTRNSECADSGIENAVCEEGCCVEGSTSLPPCTAHLDPCESSAEQTTADFFCDEDGGVCMQRCDIDTADDTQSADCPLNSYCLIELTASGEPDPEALLGVCLPGDCDTNIFDEAACGGTGTCLAVGNGASYCIDGGTAAAGDACNQSDADEPPASDICAPGLSCFNGECIEPCNRRDGDADCEEGLSCLAAFDTTPRNQPGVCGVACEPFSVGTCGEEQDCQPVLGRFGINEWMCQDTPDGTVIAIGEECGGDDEVCEPGSICVSQTETTSVCLSICDPLGESELPSASCSGGAAGGPEIIGELAFGEASDYLSMAAGDVPAEIRGASDDALIASTTLGFQDGIVGSAVVTFDETAGPDVFVLTDWADGDTLPEVGVRLANAYRGYDQVELWLSWVALEAAAGDAFETFTLDPAESWMVDGAFGEGDWVDGAAYSIYKTPTDLVFNQDMAPTLSGDEAGLRFFHGVPGAGAVDVYVGCDAAVPTGTVVDCDEDTPAAANVAEFTFDADGDFTAIDSTATLTVYVLPAGSDPVADALDLIYTTTLSGLTAGESYTAALFDGALAVDAIVEMAEFPEAGEFSLTLGSFTDDAYAIEIGMLATSALPYGEAVDGETSSYMSVPADDYTVTVIDATEGGAAGTVTSDPIAVDDLTTIFIAGADGAAVQFFATTDDVTEPADGEGSLRAVHAGDGAPAVVVTEPGESTEVCSPSAIDGFGFCQEGCDPFPRGGDYGCEDDNTTCLPFVSRDDRPVEPQGFCTEDEGTVEAGGTCENPGFLGGDCADFAVCLNEEEGDVTGECFPLCEPFATGGCADYPDFSTCSGVPPLLGQLNFSFCLDAQAGDIGDRCTEEGFPCAADGSLCIDIGGGAECVAICRSGFDDCSAFDDLECETGALNPEVVPSYMGLCL